MIECRICLYDIRSHYDKTSQLEFTPNLYRFHNPLEMDVSNLTLLTWTSLFGQIYSYLKSFFFFFFFFFSKYVVFFFIYMFFFCFFLGISGHFGVTFGAPPT